MEQSAQRTHGDVVARGCGGSWVCERETESIFFSVFFFGTKSAAIFFLVLFCLWIESWKIIYSLRTCVTWKAEWNNSEMFYLFKRNFLYLLLPPAWRFEHQPLSTLMLTETARHVAQLLSVYLHSILADGTRWPRMTSLFLYLHWSHSPSESIFIPVELE